jgi:diaminopimelate decarboxylase
LYDEKEIVRRVKFVKSAFDYHDFRLLYSIKANGIAAILQIFKREQCGVDAASPGDVFLAKEAGFRQEDIFATGTSLSDEDMQYFIENKITVDLDAISQIKKYRSLSPGNVIGLRINPGFSAGSFLPLRAGGLNSKLGISLPDVDLAFGEAKRNSLVVNGLHFHIGSSVFDTKPFLKALRIMLDIARRYPVVSRINIGGGCGVAFEEHETDCDLIEYGKAAVSLVQEFNLCEKRNLRLCLELGEYLMWPSACAIGQVTSIKYSYGQKYVGTDLNSNHIPTPALYNCYHKVNTFSIRKKEQVNVVGNLCFVGDVLAKGRRLNRLEEGECIVMQNAGAYCVAKSSHFNSRLLPKEIIRKENGEYELIREETLSDLLTGQKYEKK